jgi:hypothetical protein
LNLFLPSAHPSIAGSASLLSPTQLAQERCLKPIFISIGWLFMFCHAWCTVSTVYQAANSKNGLEMPEWPNWLVIIKHFLHTLITFNLAVNFLIYVLKNN